MTETKTPDEALHLAVAAHMLGRLVPSNVDLLAGILTPVIVAEIRSWTPAMQAELIGGYVGHRSQLLDVVNGKLKLRHVPATRVMGRWVEDKETT